MGISDSSLAQKFLCLILSCVRIRGQEEHSRQHLRDVKLPFNQVEKEKEGQAIWRVQMKERGNVERGTVGQ